MSGVGTLILSSRVSPELHIFTHGAQGLGKGDQALDRWLGLLENWLHAQGLLTVDKSAIGTTP